MSTINARTKSVRQLLSNVEYSIDFYQREFAWKQSHVEELIQDLFNVFDRSYKQHHEREQVRHYPHYFLGTIITSTENQQRYIVDGQQRLTSLTLLLVYLRHLSQRLGTSITDVSSMIRSTTFGKLSFNINVDERKDCMLALFESGQFDIPDHASLSVRNLVNRYKDIQKPFQKNFEKVALPYFVDWLIENVVFVEIETYSGFEAFTIFETMNDRGLSLNPTDLLKGYLLAHIDQEELRWKHITKEKAEKSWRRRIHNFYMIQNLEDEDQRFFVNWLRAKYAATIRQGKKGATNQDFENITEYHRWVRNSEKELGLNGSQDFYDFIARRFDRFAEHYIRMRRRSLTLTEGYEAIYFNANRNFTLQYMLALAPIRIEDCNETADKKIYLVTTFIDIYIARRMVNFRRLNFNTIHNAMFNLAKEIRDLDVPQLRCVLVGKLKEMDDRFAGILHGYYGRFGLNNFTPNYIRYLLARMTAWVEQQAGYKTTFRNYLYNSKGKPCEIEHIWANKYQRHQEEFSSEIEFQQWRNYFGGLVLLPPGTNQSYGDMCYEEKVEHYIKENLLAASLHPLAYENNPNFTHFKYKPDLPFKPHSQFKRDDLMARQELYRQICERIWSPDRLLESS